MYGLDQLSKFLVVTNLTEGEVVPVLGTVLQWQFVEPRRGLLIASGMTWIFTIRGRRDHVHRLVRPAHPLDRWALVFGLLLGGVLGNLTDRLLREPSFGLGHVIDYISTPWLIPAIYNVADIAIVSSMVLFMIRRSAASATASVSPSARMPRPRRSPRPTVGERPRRRPTSRHHAASDGTLAARGLAAGRRVLSMEPVVPRARRARRRARRPGPREAPGAHPGRRHRGGGERCSTGHPSTGPPAGGRWLEVSWRTPRTLEVEAIAVPDLGIVHDDDDLVVVDKPAGVAAHPRSAGTGRRSALSPRPDSASRRRALPSARAWCIGSTPARAGSWSSPSPSAPTPASSGSSTTARSRRSTTRSCRGIPIRSPARSTRPSVGTALGVFAVADGKHAVTHYETIEAFPYASLLEVHLETGRRTRSACTWRRSGIRAPAMRCTARIRTLSARLGLERQWHAKELSLTHPGNGEWTTFESEYPADLAHALELLRGD